jgi:hypothetical protein
MSATPFQAILQKALADYSGQVGIDLDKHPFNDELRGCDSPEGVVKLFEDKMKGFKVDRYGNCKLTNWLSPVVQVIHALSDVLGEAVVSFVSRIRPFGKLTLLGAVPTNKGNPRWHRCFNHSAYPLTFSTHIFPDPASPGN